MLRCPCCRRRQFTWLTCTFLALPFREQCMAYNGLPDAVERSHLVPCKKLAWTMVKGPSFDELTVTPSLDASASGHWHGFIKDGSITGGNIG